MGVTPPSFAEFRSLRRRPGAWLAFLTIVGFAVYFIGLRGPYFLDDYVFYFDPPPPYVFYFFNHAHVTRFYRPLQATLLIAIQRFAGLETLPIHLIQVAMHVALAYLVYRALLRYGASWRAAALASLFLLVAQISAEAVEGNDTFSQVGCALFGWSALWALDETLRAPSRAGALRLGAACIGLFALALLSKESAASFVVLIAALIAIRIWRTPGWRRRAPAMSISLGIVLVCYLVQRSRMGAAAVHLGGSDRYGFHLGPNIALNLAQFTFAAALPFSTATAFIGIARHDPLLACLSFGSVLVVIGVVSAGLRGVPRLLWLPLLTAAVVALFPVVFLNKVSELYLYNALPPLAALAGIGFAAFTERVKFQRLRFGIVAIIFIDNALGAAGKSRLMAENGRRQNALMAGVVRYRSLIPAGGSVILVNPPGEPPNYSVLVEHDFDVLQDSEPRLAYLLGLPANHVRLADRVYDSVPPEDAGRSLRLTVTPDSADVHPAP